MAQAPVSFEDQLKSLSADSDYVSVKFLGLQSSDVAKLFFALKEDTDTNHLVLVTLPSDSSGNFYIESSLNSFDSKANGYALELGYSTEISKLIHYLVNLYRTQVGNMDDEMDVSEGEEQDWEEEEGGWDDDEPVNEDELPPSSLNTEVEKYARMKTQLFDESVRLRSSQTELLHQKGIKDNQQIFKPDSVAYMLINQIISFHKAFESGANKTIHVTPVNNSIYEWRVRFSHFPADSNIALDLLQLNQRYDIDYVELRVKFLMELYPIYPPELRLVKPRLENFLFGRIVCMEEVQVSKWNPVRTMEDIFSAVFSLLCKHGHIDVNKYRSNQEPYSQVEFLLLRLSMLTEIPFRANTLMSEEDYQMKRLPSIGSKNIEFQNDKPTEEVESPPKKKQRTNHWGGAQDTNYTAWAKGTGYGHAGDCGDWDMEAWKLAQAKKDSEILEILVQVVKELRTNADKADLKAIFSDSCIIPFLKEYLKNDSLLDVIQNHAQLYSRIFEIVEEMAKHAELLDLFLDRCKSPTTTNMALFEVLQGAADKCKIATSFGGGGGSSLGAGMFTKDTGTDIPRTIMKTFTMVEKAMKKNHVLSKKSDKKVDKMETDEKSPPISDADLYCNVMKGFRFETASDNDFLRTHHYAKNSSETNKKFVKRLGFEYADLAKSVPINVDSSIFLRVHEDKMHFAKFLIIPCDDTPYASGCFVFDAYFPPQYPDVPPKVNLMTTGGGSVRFNPNLYNCGKVCLSLLGTWRGGASGEDWNAKVSTFLQLLVSIQSLIFVPQPYFNEPGYERSMGTPEGNRRTKEYNDNIRLRTVQWAMIDVLKKPPKCFESLIKQHFKLQKERVLKNATDWLGSKHAHVKELTTLLNKL